jgi:hypothetical protein
MTSPKIASWGTKFINSRITAESGSKILGKLTVFRSPEFEVMDLAPEEKEPEKNEKRKTPVIKNGIKLAGLSSPSINPKTNP